MIRKIKTVIELMVSSDLLDWGTTFDLQSHSHEHIPKERVKSKAQGLDGRCQTVRYGDVWIKVSLEHLKKIGFVIREGFL